jgi:hypothetical protein
MEPNLQSAWFSSVSTFHFEYILAQALTQTSTTRELCARARLTELSCIFCSCSREEVS